MLRKILLFLGAMLLVSILVIAQTTLSNFIWLIQVDMPVTFGIVISRIFQDIFTMGLLVYPIVLIINLLIFLVAVLLVKFTNFSKVITYSFAGGVAMLLLAIGIPLMGGGIYGISGARSIVGKLLFILFGILGGYVYGKGLKKD